MTGGDDPISFLLVDDLQENLLALEALLRREGLVCLKARTGEEALELLLVHDVALALVDVQMPGMDGFELAEIMRGSERARHVPIIFLTAGTTDRQRRFRGYEAGAVDFLQKPIEADILRSKANVFFDLHQQRRQIIAQRDVLEAYAETLRSADRRKNEFLAVLGHEIRNPIMALDAGLHFLRRPVDAERAETIHAQMGRQVAHLTRLVDDLLDISRIDQGKIALIKEPVTLQSVLEFAIEATTPQIEAAGHRLEVEMPQDSVWLHADPTRLAQVISNLLNNAVKYTPAGGRIALRARTTGEAAEVEVADNGVGIPEEMQTKIFDLFAQVKTPNGRAQEGLGIGLALGKQLIELHGGAIRLTASDPASGSTFQVRLPLTPSEQTPAGDRRRDP